MMRRAQPWLGCLVDISIDDALPPAILLAAFDAAFKQIARVHQLMSFHAPDSDLTIYNQSNSGAVITVAEETYDVLQAAQRLRILSGGLFDVTVAQELMAWDLLPMQFNTIPELASAGCGAEVADNADNADNAEAYILLEDFQVKKCTTAVLDLGGIAKGYAVDLAIQALQKNGVQQACVNAGGDLRVIGERPLQVGIRDPHQPQQIRHSVSLMNQAMASSSDYFSRQAHQGEMVSALVHGKTRQALQDIGSITVCAAECIWADALTKVVAVSGDARHPCLQIFSAQAIVINKDQVHGLPERVAATLASEEEIDAYA
jgi:thiamine biosynthesis lipoprotein